MREYTKHSAFNMFVADWAEYRDENKIKVCEFIDGYMDVKIMTPKRMPLRECRYKNKLLGINGINKRGNINWIKSHKI